MTIKQDKAKDEKTMDMSIRTIYAKKMFSNDDREFGRSPASFNNYSG